MIHSIGNQFLTVQIDGHGAQLKSILAHDGTQYLWQGDPRYWKGQAPNLFPYVGRLKDGQYTLDGEQYQMKIHGFASIKDFQPVEIGPEAITFQLQADPETRQMYPRDFLFQICYRLENNTLHITYRVENRDEKTMYFGVGGHPGFRVPLVPGKAFTDYRLTFASPCKPRRVLFGKTCLITGEDAPYPLEQDRHLLLKHDLFDDDAVVLKDMDTTVTLHTPADSHAVTVSFPQMPYIGFWHMPHTDAPYVCIEPWVSLPAGEGGPTQLDRQEDLVTLAPGQVYENHWTIQIHI